MVLEFRKSTCLCDEYQNLLCWLIFICILLWTGQPIKTAILTTYSVGYHVVIGPSLKNIEGEKWLSGRVLDLIETEGPRD